VEKQKILFWIGSNLVYLGIAKYLQEKNDFDIYAVIDYSHKAKKFFENQELVNFKKIWFYRDEIEGEQDVEIDLKYLKKIEEKYKIKLWDLLLSERYFYSFNPYWKFTDNELLKILERECRFFESVLKSEKFDYMIMKVTDNQQNHLFHHMCKISQIKIISFDGVRFANRTMICVDGDKFEKENLPEPVLKERSREELLKYMKGYSANIESFVGKTGMSISEKINVSLQYLKTISDKKSKKFFGLWGREPMKILQYGIKMHLESSKRKSFLDSKCIKKINNEKMIYFPLHYEPERVLLIATPYYTNQLEVITNIAKSLPIDYKLYVKEHPMMSKFHWREINYYQKIINLPNVELIHPSVSNESIFEICDLVITIAGSSGLESLFYGKPSIVFSDVIFSDLSSVKRIKNYEELPKAIEEGLNRKVNFEELNQFVNFVEQNTFEFDMALFVQRSGKELWYGGVLDDDELDDEKFKKHIEKNEREYNILITQILKKISNAF
jgi:hypothetical protein